MSKKRVSKRFVQEYVVERRFADGSLDLKGEQPPFLVVTEDQIFDYYFRFNKDQYSVSMETVARWYAEKGWSWRQKTW